MEDLLTFEELLEVDEDEIALLLNDYDASKKLRATTSHQAFVVLPRYPQLVIDCIEYLRFNGGLQREGIFRVNGDSKSVDRIRAAYEEGRLDPLSEVTNINVFDVATTLKAYFRVLRDPLIPEDIYERMKDAVDSGAEMSEQVELLRNEVSNIPSPNLQVLAYIMKFFQEVVAQSELNKMTAKNMGTCLTMSITRFEPTKSKTSSNLAAMMEIGLSTKILSILISDIDYDLFLTPQQQQDMKKKAFYKPKAPEKPPRRLKQSPIKQTVVPNSVSTESFVNRRSSNKKTSGLLDEFEIDSKDFKENLELKEAKEQFKSMTNLTNSNNSNSNIVNPSVNKLRPKVPARPTRQGVNNGTNTNNSKKKKKSLAKSESNKALEKFNIEV